MTHKLLLVITIYTAFVVFMKLQLIEAVDGNMWPIFSAYWLGFAVAFAPFPKD